MSVDEVVVEDSLSEYCLHRLHVIRLGTPVDAKKWMNERIKGNDEVTLMWQYEERELGIHHLRLYWKEAENAG
jgi:hypothetical protein